MKNFKVVIASIISILSVGVLVVFFMNGFQNKAINLEEQIKTAHSDINIQEKRRVDLIYNLVDTVKQYDKHEYNTLKDIVDARSSGKGDIGEVTTMINAAAEAYPELKSSENYKQLMNELSITENMIAEYRTNYNEQIREYNRYIKKFPTKQFLSILGYEPVEFDYLEFEVSSDAPQNLFGE